MARADAIVNQQADAVVALLRLINAGPGVNEWGAAADSNKWASQPLSVHRRMLSRTLTIEQRPTLGLEIMGWKSDLMGGGLHQLTTRFGIHCIVQGDDDNAEVNLNKLAGDAVFAITQDESLAGTCEYVEEDFSYEPHVEIALQSGLGVATVTFAVTTKFTHTTTSPP